MKRTNTADTRQRNFRLPALTRQQLADCAEADGMSEMNVLILALDHYTRLRAAERLPTVNADPVETPS